MSNPIVSRFKSPSVYVPAILAALYLAADLGCSLYFALTVDPGHPTEVEGSVIYMQWLNAPAMIVIALLDALSRHRFGRLVNSLSDGPAVANVLIVAFNAAFVFALARGVARLVRGPD